MRVAGLWTGLIILAALLGPVAEARAGLVEVSWTAPTTNANGSPLTDLAGYRVYMGTSSPACPGSSYHAVAASDPSPAANQTVRATITGLNAGTTYWVRITAVDSRGNQSGCTAAASGVARGTISVSPTSSVSFGSLAIGAILDRTFTVQNTSSASLSGGATVGAPFSIVSGGSFTLAAGASQNVVVRFRPTVAGSFASNVNFTAQGDTIARGVNGATIGSAPDPPSATPTLSITRGGSGSGTVTGSGINCGSDCTQSYVSGTRVTLTASAASGSRFASWSGACSGTATACTVVMNAAATVTATFTSTSTRPDLAVTALTVPSTWTRGALVSMTFNVVNTGSAAGSAQLRIYMSRDSQRSSDDVQLHSRTYSSIAAGASLPSAFTGTVPSAAPPGTYYLIIVIDATATVSETSESNNSVTKAVTVR
jgi:CARDB/Divergent InlB B-repeat domain